MPPKEEPAMPVSSRPVRVLYLASTQGLSSSTSMRP